VLGYVVGKRAAAPEGSSVRFELTAPMARRVDIAVTDRARVLAGPDGLAGEPTVTLTVPGDHFMRLAGGRGADPGRVAISGDTALGERIVANLAFML
jgi:MDMPI C-terminal domain